MKPLTNLQNGAVVTMLMYFTLLFFSCSREEKQSVNGTLKLTIGVSVIVHDANYLKSGTGDFAVEIYSSNDVKVKEFEFASGLPDSIELPEGTYYAVAYSHNNLPAAFENPYYYGKSDLFTITSGESVSVSITCKLSNIKVTVHYTSKVQAAYLDFSTKIKNNTDSLIFVKDEIRAGYFSTGPLNIESTLSYNDGGTVKTKKVLGGIPNALPGKHYEIRIDASALPGSSSIDIILNDTCETEAVNFSEEFGKLLITEIMPDPLKINDDKGEWIEIYNNSSDTINLKGLVIRKGTTSNTINSDIIIAPGYYAVLANSTNATNNVNYVYNTSFSNSGFSIVLATYGTNGSDGEIIFSVVFGSAASGKSLQLNPSVKNPSAAQLMSNWCIAKTAYSTGDYGTPGAENSNCE